MKVYIVTPFPDMINSIINSSILAKSQERDCVEYYVYNLFDFANKSTNKRIDDYPFGGGAGMILKPEPIFEVFNLINNDHILTNSDIENKITIINFFASWCLPCKDEHPILMELKNNFPKLMIIGFNYKDNNKDALKFLKTNGNPYSFVGIDNNGKIGFEFGVLGLPETFLTNNKGKIIYRLSGP